MARAGLGAMRPCTLRLVALAGILAVPQLAAQETVGYFSEYAARGGHGTIVLVISGATGPHAYAEAARDLAAEGYHTVLLDGTEFRGKTSENAAAMLLDATQRARKSAGLPARRVGVVGYSLGGRPALAVAATRPDLVFAVATHYPATSFIGDAAGFVGALRVPTLLMAGGRDFYNRCCLAETARRLDAASRSAAAPRFLEVVEYPDADHAWNLNAYWNGKVAADSFKRALAHLKAHDKP